MKAISDTDIPKYCREYQGFWEEILRRRANRSIYVGDAGDKETAMLLQCEVDGGDCPRCGDPWKEITFKNMFGHGRYFEPTCLCYPKCPRCRNWQYEEFSAGILKAHDWKCDACGFQLIVDGKRRYGPNYEKAWGEMTRWQQFREAIIGTPEEKRWEGRKSKKDRDI